MRKILVIVFFPVLFAILGGYLFELLQRIPKGNWEMIWSNQYDLHRLDSRPSQVLNAQWDSVYIKTESGNIYYCDHERLICEQLDKLNFQNIDTLEISRDFSRWEIPSFSTEKVDVVRIKVDLPETVRYQYYLTALDGSIWFWYWGDTIFEDITGWARYGSIGGLAGIAIALLVERKLKQSLAPAYL